MLTDSLTPDYSDFIDIEGWLSHQKIDQISDKNTHGCPKSGKPGNPGKVRE